MKIKERIQNYFKKRKPLSIIFDFIFYLLILLLLIPGTRKKVAPVFIRTFLHAPLSVSPEDRVQLSAEDYQWPLADASGNPVYLSRFQDKVIFLNFWATWCPPCRAEMPSIQKLYNDYKDKIAFVLVTTEKPETVHEYFRQENFDMPVYYQTYESPPDLATRSIPTTFIIDRKGSIALTHKGASKWNARKIRRLIDGLTEE